MPSRDFVYSTVVHKWKEFNYGDRVLYIGNQTSGLNGRTGTVTKSIGRQELNVSNIPVVWDGTGKHTGVFPRNVELIAQREPDWEL